MYFSPRSFYIPLLSEIRQISPDFHLTKDEYIY